MNKLLGIRVSAVYPLSIAKLERKGHSKDELDEVIHWLTGFDEAALEQHLAAGTTFEQFFGAAQLNRNASLITGRICGMRVEEIDDPLMQKIRYLDKLVDEVANGRAMAKVLRTPVP